MSLAVATDVRACFDDGVFFVALAPVSDPDLVAPAVAQVLGLKETTRQAPLDRLVHSLRDKLILLVLDNFEQVIDAAPVVARLLSACPMVKLLVTIRIALWHFWVMHGHLSAGRRSVERVLRHADAPTSRAASHTMRLLNAASCLAYNQSDYATAVETGTLDCLDYDRAVNAARAGLSEASFQAAWAAGRSLTLKQAIAYVLEPAAASWPKMSTRSRTG